MQEFFISVACLDQFLWYITWCTYRVYSLIFKRSCLWSVPGISFELEKICVTPWLLQFVWVFIIYNTDNLIASVCSNFLCILISKVFLLCLFKMRNIIFIIITPSNWLVPSISLSFVVLIIHQCCWENSRPLQAQPIILLPIFLEIT